MTLQDGSPAVGHPIYELRLPPDAAVVAILREGHVVIPQPETVLAIGDEVLALANAESEWGLREAIVGSVAGGMPPDSRSDGQMSL